MPKLNLEVGAETFVYVAGFSRRTRIVPGKVTKVTPTGQMTVEIKGAGSTYTERFDAYGQQIGSASAWRKNCLVTRERYEQHLEHNRQDDAQRALRAQLETLPKLVGGNKQELIDALNLALAQANLL